MPQILSRAVVCVCLLTGWIAQLISQEYPLSTWYEMARSAYLDGNYADAKNHFDGIEEVYSNESLFKDPKFQKYFKSMYAMSALLSGDYSASDHLFSEYLDTHYSKSEEEAVMLIAAIQTKKKLDRLSESIPYYLTFLEDYPEHPDVDLMTYEMMLLHFTADDVESANKTLSLLTQPGVSVEIRNRARLTMIQELIKRNDFEQARDFLLKNRWKVNQMPELAVLATSALKIGGQLMQQQDYLRAIRAFRLVPFYQALLDAQKRRLQILEARFEAVKNEESRRHSMIWESHYELLIQQVKARLDHLEKSKDYTPSFLLKYGRCYLHTQQYAEAWVIFRSLALTEGLDSSIEEQAWYHWTLASHGAENWDEALDLCREFSQRYPDSPLLPQALYLLARTHQEMGDLLRANEVLTYLIQNYPENEQRDHWLLTRGFHFASLDENRSAILDFDSILGKATGVDFVRARAGLWRAIALSGEENYDASLSQLEDLIQGYPDHWMYPEFLYRKGTVYYSKRDYDASEVALRHYLSAFPDHPNHQEAKVLLGDVFMGKGMLETALYQFESIDTSEPRLFMYAYFQIGKIYKALERYHEMEALYRRYLDEVQFEGKSRINEALYQLGWAMTQLKRKSEVIPLYLDAVARYGNDPGSSEVVSMIQSLDRIKRESSDSEMPLEIHHSEPVRSFVNAHNFEQWLLQQMRNAESNEQLTYFARLQLYEAIRLRYQKEFELANAAIRAISIKTPIAAMDDQLLGEIGVALIDANINSGVKLLKQLLVKFPGSAQKALAYYGLGLYESRQESSHQALKWLRLFEKETPSHPKQIEVKLLKATALIELERFDDASDSYNEILRLKQARGIPHVRALEGLAELYEQKGDFVMAVPYWQRVYTLYRAYIPFVSKAYLRSALLFEKMGDLEAALRTCLEMLDQPDLVDTSEHAEITLITDRLQKLVVEPAAQESKETEVAM